MKLWGGEDNTTHFAPQLHHDSRCLKIDYNIFKQNTLSQNGDKVVLLCYLL